MIEHTVKFAHNTISGTFRATCSCGWLAYSTDKAMLECSAACHDLDDEPAKQEAENVALAEVQI